MVLRFRHAFYARVMAQARDVMQAVFAIAEVKKWGIKSLGGARCENGEGLKSESAKGCKGFRLLFRLRTKENIV